MRRNHVLWMLVLLALPLTGLLVQGLAPAGAATLAAALNCTYLPLVSVPGASTASASTSAAAPASTSAAAPAYAGATAGCPAPPEAPAPPTSGAVKLRPEILVVPYEYQPVQYVVVLDQSGSMSANFKGQCDNRDPPAQDFVNEPARFWQCANGPLYQRPDGTLAPAPDNTRVVGVGTDYWWSNPSERRIGVAKRGLETLIKLTNMPGNAGYNGASPSDQMALVWFTDMALRNGNNEVFANGTPFSNAPAELISKLWARSTGSNPYLTAGGTNGAAGLYRASQLLDDAPDKVIHTNGQSYTYRRVVLFITDGVSNQFFHESESDLKVQQSDFMTYPAGHPCRTIGWKVIEDADCQTTRVGGVYTTTLEIDGVPREIGLDRPITQMVSISRERLQRSGVAVFTVALSDLPTMGLPAGVSSFPSYYRTVPMLTTNVDGSTNVDRVVKDINLIVEDNRCQRAATATWVTSMAPANRPEYSRLTFPQVGEVVLTETTTRVRYSLPITVSELDGTMDYSIADVPAGTYRLDSWLLYRGDDGITRFYSYIDEQDRMISAATVTLTGNETAPPQLALRLNGDVCDTVGGEQAQDSPGALPDDP